MVNELHTPSLSRDNQLHKLNEGHTAYNAAKQFSARDKVDPYKRHIYYHDVYGDRFQAACASTEEMEANVEDF